MTTAHRPVVGAIRTGLARGTVEARNSLRTAEEVGSIVVFDAIFLVVLHLLRDKHFPGTSLSLAVLVLPGIVGMWVTYTAINAANIVAFEQEDGTLLRAKTVPYGLVAYVSGLLVRIPALTALSVVAVLVPGVFVVDGIDIGWGGAAMIVVYFVLGTIAALPLGLIIGGLAGNPRTLSFVGFLCSAVLIGVSGIFYPITGLPGWIHPIAQIFPYYWAGLGMRSAMLPDSAHVLELTGSWRPGETIAVLAAWGIAGLLLAPVVLRRISNRQSGAAVEAGRLRAAQRVG